MPSKKKRKGGKESGKMGEEKAKSRSQDCCVTFKSNNDLAILLSVHARTSQANILHLDQKAVKCTTCKQLYGKF